MADGVAGLLRWAFRRAPFPAVAFRTLARMHASRAAVAAAAHAASRGVARASAHEWGWFTLYLPGTETPLFARPGTSDLQSFKAIFSRRQHHIELDFEPRVIFDLGANVGYAAVDFALRYPDARIVAVEPEPSNVHVLRLNAAPFGEINLVEAAVWPRRGALALDDVGNDKWGFQVREAPTTADAIRGITVPELMERAGVISIDLLKVDIEGAEHELLSENTDWLEHVRAIVIELHEMWPGATAASEAVLASYGFEQCAEKDENRYYARPAPTRRVRVRRRVPVRPLLIGHPVARPRRHGSRARRAMAAVASTIAAFVLFGLVPEALRDWPYNPFGGDSRAHHENRHH